MLAPYILYIKGEKSYALFFSAKSHDQGLKKWRWLLVIETFCFIYILLYITLFSLYVKNYYYYNYLFYYYHYHNNWHNFCYSFYYFISVFCNFYRCCCCCCFSCIFSYSLLFCSKKWQVEIIQHSQPQVLYDYVRSYLDHNCYFFRFMSDSHLPNQVRQSLSFPNLLRYNEILLYEGIRTCSAATYLLLNTLHSNSYFNSENSLFKNWTL